MVVDAMGFDPKNKTILVVDDEADLCEILQFDLEDAGYNTFIANQAHEALEKIEQNAVDLVVSDIRMPGGDGVFLLDSLRAQDLASPPVIFVSGFADITVDEAYHKGVNSVFAKPLATERLMEYIEFCIESPMERWKKRSNWEDAPILKVKLPEKEDRKVPSPIIGRGGAFIPLDQPLSWNSEKVHLRIEIPETQSTIEGLGICRWQRTSSSQSDLPKGVGIEFLELSDESIVYLNKYLEENQVRPHIPMG